MGHHGRMYEVLMVHGLVLDGHLELSVEEEGLSEIGVVDNIDALVNGLLGIDDTVLVDAINELELDAGYVHRLQTDDEQDGERECGHNGHFPSGERPTHGKDSTGEHIEHRAKHHSLDGAQIRDEDQPRGSGADDTSQCIGRVGVADIFSRPLLLATPTVLLCE